MELNRRRHPPEPESSLDHLRRLVEARETGEMICARGGTQAHVYLQHGRIAWGTDTEHPFAFGRRIMEICQIERVHFTSLVAACRCEKRPIGEALVDRGLATREQVRDALRHQAALAVRALTRQPSGDCAFFQRKGFSSYDSRLTFSLEEVLGGTNERAADLPRVTTLTPQGTSLRQDLTAPFVREVTGCEWTDHLEGERRLTGHGPSSGHRVPRALLKTLLSGDSDFLAVRSGSGAVMGARLDGLLESLWCGVAADAPFGAAYAVLSRCCGLDRRSLSSPSMRAEGSPVVLADGGRASSAPALRLMSRAPDAVAVCHLDESGVASWVGRRGCEQACRPESLTSLVTAAFGADVLPSLGAPTSGYGLRTAVFGGSDAYIYGAELPTGPRASLWLVTSRRTAQGFGWACLTALVRELGEP